MRQLLATIQLCGEGEPARGLRAWADALTRGTPLLVAIEPALEDALAQEYFVLPSESRSLPEHLRAGDGPGREVELRVAGGRVLLLSVAGALALERREAQQTAQRQALSERLRLQPRGAEPVARFAARVAAVWGRPIEVDPRLAGAVTVDYGTRSVREWLDVAAPQVGGVVAIRPEGTLLTVPDRAARIARGPVADLLVASQLRERTLETPIGDREWSLTALIDRLEREMNLDWPEHLRVAQATWRFDGSSVAWSYERWLMVLTRVGGLPAGSDVPVIPTWRIHEARVEIYDGTEVAARFFEHEHDD